MKEPIKLCLRVLSPLHVGCDEVYEPTSFLVDERTRRLTVFDPLEFVNTLTVKEKVSFLQICRKGTIPSILELYVFMRRKQCHGKEVEVCPGFIEQYQKTLSIPLNDSRRIQQELSNFVISRTAFNSSDARPYIPGSAIKGALRTAYLNIRAADQKISTPRGRSPAKDLESKLLDAYTFETDPFRLLKVSDFRPVGEVRTRILYAVNQKKKPSRFQARGPFQILEVIEPGSLFEGAISVVVPEKGAGIKKPLTFEKLIQSAQSFYSREMNQENAALAAIEINNLAPVKRDDGFMLRLGRHSGAECLTIEGHRAIKIMQARGEKPKIESSATTLWLASDFSKPLSQAGLRPFGWGAAEAMSEQTMRECELMEQDYQLGRKASEAKKPHIAPEISGTSKQGFGSPSQAKPPVREVWPSATLAWSPGNQVVSASFGGKKATGKGKELIPEIYRERLFAKKKTINATIEVEAIGNSYGIVRIVE